MKEITIIDPANGNEIAVSTKAFDTIYSEKGFTVKDAGAADQVEAASGKIDDEAKTDGPESIAQTGESTVSTGSGSTGSTGSGNKGSVQRRGKRKDKSPAGT